MLVFALYGSLARDLRKDWGNVVDENGGTKKAGVAYVGSVVDLQEKKTHQLALIYSNKQRHARNKRANRAPNMPSRISSISLSSFNTTDPRQQIN